MARPAGHQTALVQLLNSAAVPVYLLDEQRRIVYGNPACADWLGVEIGTLIGLRCDYHGQTGAGASELAAGLCPPPESFSGRRMSGTVARQSGAGATLRRAEFLPLGSDPLVGSGLLVVVAPTDLPDAGQPLDDVAEEHLRLHARLIAVRRELGGRFGTARLAGESPAIHQVRRQVQLAAAGKAPVLIVGPPGSGREQVARMIHYGERPELAPPLAPLSCALLDAELLSTTMEAFVRSSAELEVERPAALLLLDVDRLPPDGQSALVGFLNIRELELQTLATARRPLLELAAAGSFRRDLAHALSTLVIQLPPLRERRQDIALLAQAFLEEANAAGGRQLGGFRPEALDQLCAYPWPNDMEELRETIQAAHRSADGPLVAAAELSPRLRLAAEAAAHPRRRVEPLLLDELLVQVEAELMRRALELARGNKTRAARLLGITRARFLRRLAQIDQPRPPAKENTAPTSPFSAEEG